jgi:PKD repeat protein
MSQEETSYEETPYEETSHNETRRRRGLLFGLLAALLLILLCILLVLVLVRLLQPAADAGGPYTVDEAQPLTFDGGGSSGWLVTDYAWDFGDGNTGSGVSPSHTYDDGPAEYTVELTVTNILGRTASDTAQVTVNNLPPTADAGGPYACHRGETITLSGTCDDPSPVDAASLTCTWAEFTGAAISQPSYTCPPSPGEVTVTLTATDKDGASAQDSAIVAVDGVTTTLKADPNGPYAGVVDEPVTFDGSGSTPADAIVSYTWDFGDGGTGTGMDATHTYSATGTYNVTLTVTDGTSEDSATTTATITEGGPNEDPVAVMEVTLIQKTAQCYRFDGSGSFDPDGEIVKYEWDFGDGNTDESKESVEYCYEASGTYTATLTVTDNLGATGSTSKPVEIPDIDPP